MSCLTSNAIITRYRVRIHQQMGPDIAGLTPLVANGLTVAASIQKVTGLSAGKYGTEELREFNKIFRVADGVRTLNALRLEARLETGFEGAFREFFLGWFEDPRIVCNVYVDILTRAWCPVWTWEYTGCTITELVTEDLTLAAGTVGSFTIEVEPYNVDVRTLINSA